MSSVLTGDRKVCSEGKRGNISETVSSLSKDLPAILADRKCLSYFVQFLDSLNALSPLKFYLDCENLKTAARLITQQEIGNEVPKLRVKSDTYDGVSENFSAKWYTRKKNFNESSESADNCSHKVLSSSGGLVVNNKNNLCSLSNVNSVKWNNLSFKNICEKVYESDRDSFSNKQSLTDDEKSRMRVENNIRNLYTDNFVMSSDQKYHDQFLEFFSDQSIVNDAVRIYKKYFSAQSPYFITMPPSIVTNISLVACISAESTKENSAMPSNCFEDAQNYVMQELEGHYLNKFLESEFYCRYCVDVLTNDDLSLVEILCSESALFYFTEYLEHEGKRNCLEFWMAAYNFRKHYKSTLNLRFHKVEAQNDAMILYEKYFSLQTPFRLRISDGVRSHMEEDICADGEKLVYCFDFAMRIIEGFLIKNYLMRFQKSHLFQNYVKDLKLRINRNHEAELIANKPIYHSSERKKSLRDCTNDKLKCDLKNISSKQNTLLAMELVSPRLQIQAANVTGDDMQIDSKQLTDPNLLWHRDKSSPYNLLTFGRIDSMGRYERDFESSNTIEEKWYQPGKSHGDRFKSAVRRLVNLPEDRNKEEIAWQVAEMIVKNVTNITLGNSDCITSLNKSSACILKRQ